MLKIGVGLDSTLNNLYKVWLLDRYNKMYGDNLSEEDLVSYNVLQYVKPEAGDKVYDILMDPGFFRTLDYRDQWTYDGFKWLCKFYDVYIISSARSDTVSDKVAWIKEKFPFFDANKFISTFHKELLNVNYIIDDAPHVVENFPGHAILLDMPYNRNVKNVIRLHDWKQIKDFFELLNSVRKNRK